MQWSTHFIFFDRISVLHKKKVFRYFYKLGRKGNPLGREGISRFLSCLKPVDVLPITHYYVLVLVV